MARSISADHDAAFGMAPIPPGLNDRQRMGFVQDRFHHAICQFFWSNKSRRYFVQANVTAPLRPDLAGKSLLAFAHCAERIGGKEPIIRVWVCAALVPPELQVPYLSHDDEVLASACFATNRRFAVHLADLISVNRLPPYFTDGRDFADDELVREASR